MTWFPPVVLALWPFTGVLSQIGREVTRKCENNRGLHGSYGWGPNFVEKIVSASCRKSEPDWHLHASRARSREQAQPLRDHFCDLDESSPI